jgi:Protein of unknown function (DUF3499)
MGKLCERPGCSDVAAIAYGFDVDRLLVWLAPRDPDGDPLRAGSLCKRHADAMVVPRGWTLDDRRESVPRLFRPAPSEDAPAPKRRRAKAPAKAPAEPAAPEAPPAAPQPTLADAPTTSTAPALELDPSRTVAEVTGEPSATDDPDATQAIPWLPTFDADDDLGGVLAARSPLLARAFRGTDRKR